VGDRQSILRQLPKIDELLKRSELCELSYPRWAVVEAARREVDDLRRAILDGKSEATDVDVEAVVRRTEELVKPSLRSLVNATGVALHTNLGRAPIPEAALQSVMEIARGYSNLEYDIEVGTRGSRHGHLAQLVVDITGAEDAVVVNNNAGAVMLALSAMAHGKSVIVSRGELIEIGGSFRIPDVMRLSGAHLVEVGTTNKTRARDYEQAIDDQTALLLKVHRSNFDIVGFTEEAPLEELVELGRERGVASMFDLGSGVLLDTRELIAMGLPAEPSVRATVATGVDVVTFSGDKLLGGPQAGIIAGRKEAVAAARKHPLMRALRPDKLTIAALHATLSLYRDGRAHTDVPTIAMLSAPLEQLRSRAEGLLSQIGDPPQGFTLELVTCESAVGGGALPTATLPSWGVALGGANAQSIDAGLRRGAVAVIGRVSDDQLVLDVRTIADSEFEAVATAVAGLGTNGTRPG
jgi:L-seryl-tRNA(Ser) seleniumtransferase